MNYGFIDDETLLKQAKQICDCLGHGKNNTAIQMILETAVVETGLGRIEDTTVNAGMGLTQFDKLPFDDIKQRNYHLRKKIYEDLKVDIHLIDWNDLRYNSFLSLLFTRMFYLLKNEHIPKTIEERAAYWKLHYNTKLGKGTVEHYLEMNKKYGIKIEE